MKAESNSKDSTDLERAIMTESGLLGSYVGLGERRKFVVRCVVVVAGRYVM